MDVLGCGWLLGGGLASRRGRVALARTKNGGCCCLVVAVAAVAVAFTRTPLEYTPPPLVYA